MIKLKPKRDENGCVILAGAETFGTITKPIGGKRQPRTYYLKSQSSERISSMMTNKKRKKYLSKNEQQNILMYNAFSTLSLEERFDYYLNQLKGFRVELEGLKKNKRKYDLYAPVIHMQIKHTEEMLLELSLEKESDV